MIELKLIFKREVATLTITDIRIKLVNKADSKLKAIASFTIDEAFIVHDIKIIDGSNGYFIAMPSRQAPDGQHKDIVHPKNTETRQMINDLVLAEYEKAKNEEL